jgi:hypothetical protein
VSLRDNRVTDLGVEALSNSLQFNTSLLRIDLSNNMITNESYHHISTALARNKTLCRCYLGSLETVADAQIDLLEKDDDENEGPVENPQLTAFAEVAKALNIAHDSNGLIEFRQMIRLILTGEETRHSHPPKP